MRRHGATHGGRRRSPSRVEGLARCLEAEPANAAADARTLIVVTVNDYRYISPGARYGFGVFAGNAFVDADAKFFEQPSRRELGTRK